MRLSRALGTCAVGAFYTTVPQVPGEVAARAADAALRAGADWLLAHGGGTPIGVAKAVALEVGLPIAAVPTTYAGSERTDIWGLTRDGRKTTGRDPRVRPRLVAYDPGLFADLPAKLSHHSLLNALAHSLEALYAVEATDAAKHAARDSLQPLLARDPGHRRGSQRPPRAAPTPCAARSSPPPPSTGRAWRCTTSSPTSSGDPSISPTRPPTRPCSPGPSATTPRRRPTPQRPSAEAWGTDDPAAFLYDLLLELNLDASLSAIGFPADGPARAAAEAVRARYDNPRPYDEGALETLLTDAWLGRRPSRHAHRLPPLVASAPADLPAPHAAHPPGRRGPALADARKVVLAVHGRGSNAERFSHDLAHRLGLDANADVAIVAPQADQNTWYPRGFRAPLADNRPHLDSALAVLDATWAAIAAHVPPEDIAVVGFSQGACLALTWLSTTQARPRTLLAFTGAHTPLPDATWAAATNATVHLSRSADDPWVPAAAFAETRTALADAGAHVADHTVDGGAHAIHPPDLAALRAALEMTT